MRRFATLPSAKSAFDLRDEAGKCHFQLESLPEILIGTHNKLQDYLFGLYAELRLRFIQALRQCNIAVMSGYGWNDKGINGTFSQWLWESDNHRLVLFHERPEEIMNSRSYMWHRFHDLVKKKQLVLVPKWLGKLTGDELVQVIHEARQNRGSSQNDFQSEGNLEVRLKTTNVDDLFE